MTGGSDALKSSIALDKHLTDAIAEFSPTPKRPDMSRGLRRLKNFTETMMASVDAEADKAISELQKSHDTAVDATRKIVAAVGGELKSATAEAEDMLNQITNEPS